MNNNNDNSYGKYVVSKVRDNYVKIATRSYNIVATEND